MSTESASVANKMKLKKAEIQNYRSIPSAVIDFDPSCRILVGINESGKSNILRALSFLSPDRKPDPKLDCREPLPDEDPDQTSFVEFRFGYDAEDYSKLLENWTAAVLTPEDKPVTILKGPKVVDLKEYSLLRAGGTYYVDVAKKTKGARTYTTPPGCRAVGSWLKPTSACPADFVAPGTTTPLKNFALVRADAYSPIPDNYLVKVADGDFWLALNRVERKLIEENLPDTIWWEYSEDNLLPASVPIDEFAASPSSCMPLYNMFLLAGVSDVKEKLQAAQSGSDNRFENFLSGIAAKTTKHFREVWKDYKSIEFSLRRNGECIIPSIKEENRFDLSQRSDGFKRFVTFLLFISADVKGRFLDNDLLLIDEPDASLHPSGCRYLRDELLRIAATNRVVFSTHSVFMIDPDNVGRHYIVSKEKEKTVINPAEAANVFDEEVLFNALGHSVFDVLQKKNLLFEGWRDKHLFKVALDGSSKWKKRLHKVGVCHAVGVPSIKNVAPLIELASRNCWIISDNDETAQREKRKYVQAKGYGEWCLYSDLDSAIEAVTGEDFIQKKVIARALKPIAAKFGIKALDEADIPDYGRLAAIGTWLKKEASLPEEEVKAALQSIKEAIFSGLSSKHIEGSYDLVLAAIDARVNAY
jgi:predicted ATPase